jgi:CHASE2 domain-containing sensor protein
MVDPSLSRESSVALTKFVHDQNLAHYRRCLAATTDAGQRKVLLQLLASELAK